jgi:hypothetical protein
MLYLLGQKPILIPLITQTISFVAGSIGVVCDIVLKEGIVLC